MQSGTGSHVSEGEVNAAILKLELFTRHKLTDLELAAWMERLGTYAKWRIKKLDEYVGPLNNKVFQFLDELPQQVLTVEEVVDVFSDIGSRAQLTHENKDLAAATFKHTSMLGTLNKPKNEIEAEERWEKEKTSLLSIHKEFRHLGLIPSFADVIEIREKDQEARRERTRQKKEKEKAEAKLLFERAMKKIRQEKV